MVGGSSIIADFDGCQANIQDILSQSALPPHDFGARLSLTAYQASQLLSRPAGPACVGYSTLPRRGVAVCAVIVLTSLSKGDKVV